MPLRPGSPYSTEEQRKQQTVSTNQVKLRSRSDDTDVASQQSPKSPSQFENEREEAAQTAAFK